MKSKNIEKLYEMQDIVWEKIEAFRFEKAANEDCARLHNNLVEHYNKIYNDLEDMVDLELGLKVLN